MDGLRHMHVYGGSLNPLLPGFRSTFREPSSPIPRPDPVNRDQIIRTFMAYSVVGRLAKVTIEAPIVRVKVLLQNQGELIKTGRLSEPYKGINDCFKKIIKNEGVSSLWRGNSAQILRTVLDIVFTATFWEVAKKFKRDTDDTQSWISGDWVARTAVIPSVLLFTYPLDYAHTRLASDIKYVKTGGERQFNGLIDAWRKTLRSDGARGIYRGFNIACVGCILGYQANTLRHKRDPSEPSPMTSFARIFLARAAFVLAAYPCDTVARRMMMTSGEAFKYKSSIDTFALIIRNEGMKSLYKGFGANLLRAVPLMCLAVALKKWGDNKGSGTSISIALQTK